jgi:hypothetical protein
MLNRERSASASAVHFLREVGSFALRTGVVIGFAGLLLLWLSTRAWPDDDKIPRTLLLSFLVLLGLTTLLRALSDGKARLSPSDRRFRWLTAAALLVYVAVMYCRPIGGFFALVPLTMSQWAIVALSAGACYIVLWLSDAWCSTFSV